MKIKTGLTAVVMMERLLRLHVLLLHNIDPRIITINTLAIKQEKERSNSDSISDKKMCLGQISLMT